MGRKLRCGTMLDYHLNHQKKFYHPFLKVGRKPQLTNSSSKIQGLGMTLLLMAFLFRRKLTSLNQSRSQGFLLKTSCIGRGLKQGSITANLVTDF